MAISLDEFWDMAVLGGKIQAIHDIFKILDEKDKDAATITMELSEYQNNAQKEFRKASLKFKMNKSEVAVDEVSIESLKE